MHPFVQQTSNQQSSGASASQQVPVDLLQNLMQIQSQMGFANPQSSMVFNAVRPPGRHMNIPNFNPMQNTQMCASTLGSVPQPQSHGGFVPQNFIPNFNVNGQLGNIGQGNPAQLFRPPNLMNFPQNPNQNIASNFNNGQFGWQNQMQNMNQLGNLALLNPSQVAALAQLLGCANQVAQPMIPQNTGFNGNTPQLSIVQPNGVAQRPNFCQQLPNASQQIQNGALNSTQNNQGPRCQGNNGKRYGMHILNSNHHQDKNFMKSPRKEASFGRFQKSRDQHKHNPKGDCKFSKENRGKGSENPVSTANPPKNGKKRSLAAFYTEKEIQQWREQRKRNYPSKVNVEKKLADKQANADALAEEAKLRSQQLKEVLAKQVELGFEIPEIPSHYLLDSEDKFHGGKRNQKPMNQGRCQKRFDKNGRFNQNNRFDKNRGTEGNDSFRKHERFPKRQRRVGNDSSMSPLSIRKPTLLQKLLSTDIKRDRGRLLQVFRFMVMNSFFEDSPEKKPLNFPKVIVNENGVGSEFSEERASSSKEGPVSNAGDLGSVIYGSDGENGGCQEEGEITD